MTGSDRAAGRLTSSVALVAGAASGIGRATALLFARQGAHVLATDIDESACQGLVVAADAGMSITTLRLDVTSEPGWERAVALVVEHERSFDILVVSAGITHAARSAGSRWRHGAMSWQSISTALSWAPSMRCEPCEASAGVGASSWYRRPQASKPRRVPAPMRRAKPPCVC